jgi:hypothetical protein
MSTPGTPESAPPDVDPARLTFKDRELLVALRRLANARSQVALLDEKLARRRREESLEPGDVARVDELEAQRERLERKARGRFGKGSARGRIGDVDNEQQRLLERLGFASYDAFCAWRDDPRLREAREGIDPVFVEFARRELADATKAYHETLALPDLVDAEPSVDLTQEP